MCELLSHGLVSLIVPDPFFPSPEMCFSMNNTPQSLDQPLLLAILPSHLPSKIFLPLLASVCSAAPPEDDCYSIAGGLQTLRTTLRYGRLMKRFLAFSFPGSTSESTQGTAVLRNDRAKNTVSQRRRYRDDLKPDVHPMADRPEEGRTKTRFVRLS